MRDRLISLVLCSLLAVTLFACGEKRGVANDSDILGDENHYTNGAGNNDNNSTNGAADKGTGSSTSGDNAHQSDVMGNSAMRGSTLNPANGSTDRTATWEQMLQNGRVHDRDGFLFDGENSHWT